MIRVLHVCDASAGWEQRLAISQLLERLAARDFEQHVAAIDGAACRRLALDGRRVRLFPRRLNLDFVAAAGALRRFLRRGHFDMIHAWGVRGAAVAASATHADPRPIVLTLFDPRVETRDAKFLRGAGPPSAKPIVCAAETVRRCLVERGVDVDRCIVIRPGVDFGVINRARQSGLRGELGVSDENVLVVTPEPVTPDGGHFAAFWATAIRSFLDPNIRVALPGSSREQRRLVRLARQLSMGQLVVAPGEGMGFERLISVADVAIAAPTAEMSSGALAWAMAAGIPIIGTAVYSVAEMIAHQLNGLLLKPASPKRLATSLARMLAERDELRRLADVARGQAYEVFSARRMVDQYRRLYENLASGRSFGDGIFDAAQVAARTMR